MTKHIYLVSIDALRFDCVPYQEDKSFLKKNRVSKYLKTPTLNKLVKKTLNFTQATTAAPYTSASHASVFTGLYPPNHGVRALLSPQDQSLKKNILTLAEVLAAEGYETVYASDEETMTRPLGIDRGFDHYFANDDEALFKFIKKNKDKKLLIFKHFFDVHDPYLLTRYSKKKTVNQDLEKLLSELAKKRDIDLSKDKSLYEKWRSIYGGEKNNVKELLPLYLKGISKFDQGRFKDFISSLEEMDEFKEGLFFFFADHGEGRCDSNNLDFFAHGGELFDEVMRVPLFVYHNSLANEISDKQVSLVDIFPTVIDLVFDEQPFFYPKYDLDGISLLDKDKKHQFTYCEMWRSNKEHPQDYPTNDNWILCQRAIRTPKHKFIFNGQAEKLLNISSQEIVQKDLERYLACRFSNEEKKFENSQDLLKEVNQLLNDQQLVLTKYTDLVNDKHEEHPIDLIKQGSLKDRVLCSYFLDLLFSIEKPNINLELSLDIPYLKLLEKAILNTRKQTLKKQIIKKLIIPKI